MFKSASTFIQAQKSLSCILTSSNTVFGFWLLKGSASCGHNRGKARSLGHNFFPYASVTLAFFSEAPSGQVRLV